jgi:replication factor C large subunit
MWIEKYRPKKISEVVGNEEAKDSFINWLRSNRWQKKAALLYGPPGVGKTALVQAAANEFNFNIIEMNASDTRTEHSISKIADPAVTLVALDKFFSETEGSLLFLDEVDGIFGREDRGGITAIIKIFSNKSKRRKKRGRISENQEPQIPVVLAANDPDLRKIKPLKKICELIRFRKVRIPFIVSLLQKICCMENIDAEFGALEKIAQNSEGDVRSAINDLQSLSEGCRFISLKDTQVLSLRNKDLNMYNILKGLFSTTSIEESKALLNNSNVDYDLLILLLHDNLPLHYKDPLDLGIAYDFISKADVFRGRIGAENWKLLKYFFNILAQVTTIPSQFSEPFEINLYPQRISSLFWTKSKRTTLENICAKIAKRCHISRRSAKLDFVPFLKAILKKDKSSQIFTWLQLDGKEFDYLREMEQL